MKGARSEQSKSGLGFGPKPVKTTTLSAVEGQAVIKALGLQEKKRHVMKKHSLEHFAEWTKWDDCMDQDRDGQRLIHKANEALFQIEITATEVVLPTPSLLAIWGEMTKDQVVWPL